MTTADGALGGRMAARPPCKGANRSGAPVRKCKGGGGDRVAGWARGGLPARWHAAKQSQGGWRSWRSPDPTWRPPCGGRTADR